MKMATDLRQWIFALCVGPIAGLIYCAAFVEHGQALISVIYGIGIGVPLLALTRGLLFPSFARWLGSLPFPIYAPLMTALSVVTIWVASVVTGTLMWLVGLIGGPWRDNVLYVPPRVIVYSLVMSIIVVFATRIVDLVGRRTFFNLIIGRYHRPVREERIFLFVDLVGSTHFAEAQGDLRAQTYLGRFFAATAEPVRRHGGTVEDYVGDLAIISWPLAQGVRGGRCVECVFDIRDVIAREAKRWQTEFGAIPRFRAALHGGPVVTAEIGVDRHKIAHFGDTVNLTARLEQLCRAVDRPVLISKPLLDRIAALPDGVTAIDLGAHDIRGRDGAIEVAALVDAKRPADMSMVA